MQPLGSIRSPDDYRRGSGMTVPARADRPAPANVTDGRFFGDEDWTVFQALPAEANTAETAARVSAVFFCVSVIAEALGSLPIDFVGKDGHSVGFPLADVISYQPNALQTGAEFWSAMAFAGALRNEAYAEPVATFDGIEIWPLNPLRVTPEWGERSLVVNYQSESGLRRLLPQELFWFTGLSDATMKPLVPWRMAKGSIDFQLALEMGGRTFFRNGRRPAGGVWTEQKLQPESHARIKDGVRRWENGGTPVLEQGLTYQAVSGSNVDSQMVELIRQRTLEMARYWRIPKSMVGEDGGTAASQEQQALEFVKYVMRPWTRRIEQAVTVRLLPPDLALAGVRAKFNLDALLRGDSATQWRNAVLARTGSVMSVNDLRTRWFGLPRIEEPWADDPRLPLNSNASADTATGGQTAPHKTVETGNA